MNRAICRVLFLAMYLVFALSIAPTATNATTVTLSDSNTTSDVRVDYTGGMVSWTVDGVDHLYRQTFYYRVGNQSGQSELYPILSSYSSPSQNILILNYTGSGFTATVSYTLFGGSTGSNISDITESINIYNTSTSGSPLDFHFFQYNDFDLGGTPNNDSATLFNANTIRQTDPTTIFSEVVVSPVASHYQIGGFSQNLRGLINSGSPYTLSDNYSSYGPTDITWAWEWDYTIAAGDSLSITKNKHIGTVPEPGTMMLLGSGLIGLAGWGRKKFRK